MNDIAFENEAHKHSTPPPPYAEGNFWASAWYMGALRSANMEHGEFANPPHQTPGHGDEPLPPPYPGHLYPPYLEDASQWPTAVTNPHLTSELLTSEEVPSYLGYSIITMIFCCLPIGIAALVFSLRTLEESRRNRHQALKSSRKALTLNHAAVALGSLIVSLVAIILLLALYIDWQ